MTSLEPDIVRRARPELVVPCAVLALLGNVAPLATMLLASVVAQHDMIANTISDLGRGPHKVIMDTGFYLNAGGMLALAIAAAHLHLGRVGWSMGVFTLALLALLITMIGLWDAFHTVGNNPPGMTVHTWLTFGLAPLYLAGPVLTAPGAARLWTLARPVFYGSAVAWIVLAVAFKLAPTSHDGILEKLAVAATMFWTVPLAWLLLRAGQRGGA